MDGRSGGIPSSVFVPDNFCHLLTEHIMPPHHVAHQPTRRNWTVFAIWRASRFVASAGVRSLKN